MIKKNISPKKKQRSVVLKILLSITVLAAVFLVILHSSPSISANGADFLRKIIGNQAVANIETVMFKIKDLVNSAEYKLGIKTPGNPFQSAQSGLPSSVPTATVLDPGKQSISTNGPETSIWVLPSIRTNSTLKDAGVWQPYILDNTGRVVAYRTFVQPDPSRPYGITAIVAFDLRATRLNFVLGSTEPYAANVKRRGTGLIPAADRIPGVLLAAFNGGFKYEHGGFGAFSNGLTSANPIAGLGTVAIYKDGKVRIGAWQTDITSSSDIVAFRQNGPPLIHNGVISNLVDDPLLWGLTVKGAVVTWRSGIALSKDEKTLFYFAGPSLTANSLADTMLMVFAENAIELDINDYWVLFDVFKGNTLVPEALFPTEMKSDIRRFLADYSRDYFYITATNR